MKFYLNLHACPEGHVVWCFINDRSCLQGFFPAWMRAVPGWWGWTSKGIEDVGRNWNDYFFGGGHWDIRFELFISSRFQPVERFGSLKSIPTQNNWLRHFSATNWPPFIFERAKVIQSGYDTHELQGMKTTLLRIHLFFVRSRRRPFIEFLIWPVQGKKWQEKKRVAHGMWWEGQASFFFKGRIVEWHINGYGSFKVGHFLSEATSSQSLPNLHCGASFTFQSFRGLEWFGA